VSRLAPLCGFILNRCRSTQASWSCVAVPPPSLKTSQYAGSRAVGSHVRSASHLGSPKQGRHISRQRRATFARHRRQRTHSQRLQLLDALHDRHHLVHPLLATAQGGSRCCGCVSQQDTSCGCLVRLHQVLHVLQPCQRALT
jgi:hypothetical protein